MVSGRFLFLLAASAAANEIEKIDSTMKEMKPRVMTSSMCNTLPLDPNMLIARYGMNISNPEHLYAVSAAVNGHLQLGSITEMIIEANDAGRVGAPVIDGLSGDTSFPYGDIKPILTVGEVNMCEENHGDVWVGVPDGMGAYLYDDETVRVIVQSESYGPLRRESYPYYVNDNGASFTGSHVQYADYDREGLSTFLTHSGPASEIVKGFGQVSTKYYNLAGEPVGHRSDDGPTVYGAHYSNTDAAGNWAVDQVPSEADWLMQSLCSAHLEEAHQWGKGIGLEDDIYITNEEWITYKQGAEFVGISMHAMDLKNNVDYAVGAVTISGFEKIVEINPQHEDYVILAVSGYNGAYGNGQAEIDARNAEYGPRPDGTDYVNPVNVCPVRIYIGMKGKMEDGSDAPADDFLARNGLRFGQVYGFATDISPTGPTGGMFRDEFHKPRENGARVDGKFVAIDWQWDGVVKNFRHDGAWHFQIDVPGYEGTTMKWWTANGYDSSGAKTEHTSPDTRPGQTAFIQGSTAGYFGHYYINDIKAALDAADTFPSEVDSTYYVYQGENDITGQIELNGAGLVNVVEQCNYLQDATQNCDRDYSVKSTFEDIDGFEIVSAKEGLFAVIQEDSGNDLGERMFISSALEHEVDGQEPTYYFMAQSGGQYNTRMTGLVGVPATSSGGPGGHEFSGVIDLSGMLAKESHVDRQRNLKKGKAKKEGKKAKKGKKGEPVDDESDDFMIEAHDGAAKRMMEHEVSINDKNIVLNVQAHNLYSGVVSAFKADRGGQLFLYQPNIPSMEG